VIKKRPFKKTAMALLVTLLFIMLISVAIGIGLKHLNSASSYVSGEKFLYQSSIIVDDVLGVLKNFKEIKDINSSEDLTTFLEYSPIPFESNGIKVFIELESARSKININSIFDKNITSQDNDKVEALKIFLNRYSVGMEFVDILSDSMGGIKENLSYNSDIFFQKPYLFRDYITSYKHFEKLSEYYAEYFDDNIKSIDFKNLFYFTNDTNNSYVIDLNHATPLAWEMMLGCDIDRAKELSNNAGFYEKLEDLKLMDDEKIELMKFKTSFFEPFLYVDVTIMQGDNTAEIKFEYDIKKGIGSNFAYEI
jgi:hypothetical protein